MDGGETLGHADEINNLGVRLTPERMEAVDKFFLTPKERAARVWNELLDEGGNPKFSTWDILCFAVEYSGQMAIGRFGDDKVFRSATLLLGRWLHNAHYFYSKEIYGPPIKGQKK